MKKLIILILTALIICSCSNKKVDNDIPKIDSTKIGNIESRWNEEMMDSDFYICTSASIKDGKVFYNFELLECETYNSLKKIIHRGENCKYINAAALAIAEVESNKVKIAKLIEQNKKAEDDAIKATKQLSNHLDSCRICQKLHNEY